MTKHSAVVYLISFFALCVADPWVTSAQAPGGAPAEPGAEFGRREREYPDPVERFLKSAPASMIRKLRNPATEAQGAAELTKYFGKSAINKWVVVHTKAEFVEPDNNGKNAARIRAESLPVTWDGGSMPRLSWLYFPASNAPAADGVKVGSEIAVYGQVRRCEIVVEQGALRFDFDLWKAKMENP
jgi:hypothetical protein